MTTTVTWNSPTFGTVVHESQSNHSAPCLVVQKVRVTAAELVALFSVGKQLIAAPGPGASIQVVEVTTRYSSDGIAFTNTGGDLYLSYGFGGTKVDNAFSIDDARAGISGTLNRTYSRKIGSGLEFVEADNINKPVYLQRYTSNLTNTGNTTSYLDVYITYYITGA